MLAESSLFPALSGSWLLQLLVHPGPSHTVLSPTETWGGMSSGPKASCPIPHQAPVAPSAHRAGSAAPQVSSKACLIGATGECVAAHIGTGETLGPGC